MISEVLNRLRERAPPAARPMALACAGVLLAGVLTPAAGLGQQGGNPFAALDRQADIHDQTGTGWGPEARSCLQARNFSGVVASDDRQVTLRFGDDTFYRVGLTKACPALAMSGAKVAGVTRSTGGMICDAYDVQLRVVSGDGTVSHCTGASLTPMTTADVKAASSPTGG